MKRTVLLVVAASMALAACGQVVRQRAEIKVYSILRPQKVLGYADLHTSRGEIVCGYVDLQDAEPGASRRKFTYDAIDDSAWVQGVTNAPPDKWLYRTVDRRVWSRCMGEPPRS
jgi:hypothetical protein